MKQRLKPLIVPWMVSPSVPQLQLSVAEDGESAVVQFIAFFALRAEWTGNQQIGFTHVEVVDRPIESFPNNPEYAIVRMTFEKVAWAHIAPAFGDRDVLNPDEFDDSLVPFSGPFTDVGEWLRDFHSLWRNTGDCPDPGAYVVESSLRLASLNLPEYTHIVVQGHDEYVEVIAQRWEWHEVG